MKILIQSSNLKKTLQCYETGLVDGVDCPFTLYSASDLAHTEKFFQAIEDMGLSSIHVGVAGSPEQVREKAYDLLRTHSSIVTVKIPINRDNLALAKELTALRHRVNITHVYNPAQAVMVAKAGVENVTVSVGAIDDFGYAGLEVLRGVAGMIAAQKVDTTVVANDLRTTHRASRAIYNGASTIVLTPEVFWEMYRHPLSHTNSGYQLPEVEDYVDNSLRDLFD